MVVVKGELSGLKGFDLLHEFVGIELGEADDSVVDKFRDGCIPSIALYVGGGQVELLDGLDGGLENVDKVLGFFFEGVRKSVVAANDGSGMVRTMI